MLESGLRDDARELINELLEAHPGHPELVQRRTRLQELDAIDADAALGSLEAHAEADDIQSVQGAQLSDLSEDDANTHFDLGMAFKEMGQYKKAVESLEKASRNREKRVEAMRLIGLCYTEQGRYADAARQLRDALGTPDLDAPVAVSLRYDLANVLEQSGNKAGARKELQAIVDAGGADFLDVQSRLTALGG